MSQHTSKQSVLFENPSKKAVIAPFDRDHANSDGGAFLLKAGVLNALVKQEEGKAVTEKQPGWMSHTCGKCGALTRRKWDLSPRR